MRYRRAQEVPDSPTCQDCGGVAVVRRDEAWRCLGCYRKAFPPPEGVWYLDEAKQVDAETFRAVRERMKEKT